MKAIWDLGSFDERLIKELIWLYQCGFDKAEDKERGGISNDYDNDDLIYCVIISLRRLDYKTSGIDGEELKKLIRKNL